MSTMNPQEIARIALREQDDAGAVTPEQRAAFEKQVQAALEHPETIPAYSSSSKQLSIVRFRCLLQDTGYPTEVYLPSQEPTPAGEPLDWSQLRERWVGWAVEIPGEQDWAKHQAGSDDFESAFAGMSLSAPPAVAKDKHPLPNRGTEYTGALLKVYGAEFSPSPASAWDVIGIVSAAPIPTPYGADEENAPLVPAVHALLPPTPITGAAERAADAEGARVTRAALVSYLASAFSPPDETAGELLLLSLLARPAVRPNALPPLGTLSLNLIRPRGPARTLETVLGALAPATLPLPVTLDLLHKARFRPASVDGTSLQPGLLQLAPGTLLVLDEDGLGSGGALNEAALKNLQSLGEALEQQSVRYEYPFMDGLRIECALRAVVTGEGKSLLPVDVVLPVSGVAASQPQTSDADLASYRAYIASHGGAAHAEALKIPDSVADAIQESFVAERKAAGVGSVEAAEARLKRRMKVARLMALSHPEAELTPALWERAVALDDEVERRAADREAKRRETKLGAPADDAAPAATTSS